MHWNLLALLGTFRFLYRLYAVSKFGTEKDNTTLCKHTYFSKGSRTLQVLENLERCWSTKQTHCIELECNPSHSISSHGWSFPLAVIGSLISCSSVDACREFTVSTAKQPSIMSNVHNSLLGMECRFTKIIFHKNNKRIQGLNSLQAKKGFCSLTLKVKLIPKHNLPQPQTFIKINNYDCFNQ